ncbi:ankyrin-1-like [Trichogramma pretiosum]|uniref:ankyrin-1-like n=1 Tax=Trichogramma pretiosum TaxID=7493 RepID=UPI000C71C093|nr:ankyrin-1-like [Trichogramma pretiosum]
MDRLETLKGLRERFNLQIEGERHKFIRQLYPLVRDWIDAVPNHRDIFREGDIESLLNTMHTGIDSLLNDLRNSELIGFLVRTGYKDEPKVGVDDEPLLRRTTPVHRAARRVHGASYAIRNLFQIFNRLDANYVDEDGVTHFHIACRYGFDDVVEKFLDLGRVDPNTCPLPTNGNSPLHLALEHDGHFGVAALLLSRGADPNSTNLEGSTPLHFLSQNCSDDSAEPFFRIVDELNLSVHIDARDKLGQTPLYLAMRYRSKKKVKSLLRRGANPNLADSCGFTPLHVPCAEGDCDRIGLIKLFFKVNNELNQSVEVDARDKWGRTPLHYAVANLFPHIVDELLDRGADLSGFAFPAEKDFDQFHEIGNEHDHHYKYNLVSGALAVVDILERRGRELYRSEALIVMKFFAKHGLIEKLRHFEFNWYEDEVFTSKAKEFMVKADLSLYDLMQLPPREVEKLCTNTDFLEFFILGSVERILRWYRLPVESRKACAMHLCEKMSRRFFRDWAMEPFLVLIHYRLPILCCEMIIDNLMNQDLCNICLAFGQNS